MSGIVREWLSTAEGVNKCAGRRKKRWRTRHTEGPEPWQQALREPPTHAGPGLLKFEEGNDEEGYCLVVENCGVSEIRKRCGCLFSRLGALGQFNRMSAILRSAF